MSFITKLLPESWVLPDNAVAEFLRKTIVDGSILNIDYWSFLHFGAGILIAFALGYLYARYKINMSRALFAILIIVGFEILEYGVTGSLIQPETKLNIIWDVIITYLGYETARYFWQR